MAKKKRQRKEQVKTFANVSAEPRQFRGKWREVFGNNGPMTLELGCGHGNYTLALAQHFPEKNFIGVDLKAARIWVGAKAALENQWRNVFFLNTNVWDLAEAFDAGEVAEIWIPFPDPYPKKPKKRLTAARCLAVYQKICAPDARLHFKTDDDALYQSTLDALDEFGCTILRNIADVYAEPELDDDLRIQTSYEKRHLAAGKTIKYVQFTLPSTGESYD